MSGFTPAERMEVDRQYRTLARALHELNPKHALALRESLAKAEETCADRTIARVLVAGEILRGVTWEGRSPLTVRDLTIPARLAEALANAEQLGRSIGPHAYRPRRTLLGFLSARKTFSQSGKEALMRCRAIGAAKDRRDRGPPAGRSVRTA